MPVSREQEDSTEVLIEVLEFLTYIADILWAIR